MGSLACCIWWLVFGVLLGWLLSWLLSKLLAEKAPEIPEPTEHVPSLKERFFDAPAGSAETYTPPNLEAEPEAIVNSLSRSDMIQAAAAAGISFSGKHHDLEIIEGIGPKIAELLNANGINTFEELSKMSVDSINAILDQGDGRFQLANPSTWAEQAQLAAQNKWAELKALQDSLDGGVDIS